MFTGFILIGCAQGLITGSTTSKGAKLSQYKTYAWTTPPDPDANTRQDDKFYAKLIENTANEELHNKGMKLNSQHPDAVFVFHTQIESQTRYSDTPQLGVSFGFGGPEYYDGNEGLMYSGQVASRQVREGLLYIEMFDTQSRKLLWRGWGKKELDSTTVKMEEEIQNAVKSVFTRLPIKIKD